MSEVRERILAALRGAGVAFREIEHEPTRTSEESARARGEDLRIGGKALLVRVGEEFHLFVLSAALRLDSGAVRSHFSVRSCRFATAEELREQTGLVPGSVPPFGRPILPFALYADPSVLANEKIAFNAGALTHSIVMRTEDWRQIAQPRIFVFGQEAA